MHKLKTLPILEWKIAYNFEFCKTRYLDFELLYLIRFYGNWKGERLIKIACITCIQKLNLTSSFCIWSGFVEIGREIRPYRNNYLEKYAETEIGNFVSSFCIWSDFMEIGRGKNAHIRRIIFFPSHFPSPSPFSLLFFRLFRAYAISRGLSLGEERCKECNITFSVQMLIDLRKPLCFWFLSIIYFQYCFSHVGELELP